MGALISDLFVNVAGEAMLSSGTAKDYGHRLGFTDTGIQANSMAAKAHSRHGGNLASEHVISRLMSETMSP